MRSFYHQLLAHLLLQPSLLLGVLLSKLGTAKPPPAVGIKAVWGRPLLVGLQLAGWYADNLPRQGLNSVGQLGLIVCKLGLLGLLGPLSLVLLAQNGILQIVRLGLDLGFFSAQPPSPPCLASSRLLAFGPPLLLSHHLLVLTAVSLRS